MCAPAPPACPWGGRVRPVRSVRCSRLAPPQAPRRARPSPPPPPQAPFTEAQRTWQLQRRGRYLEFNLLYDRGVRFGLDGGRFESVMVSAPPLIRWDYDVVPPPGSEEARLVEVLRSPRAWA